MRDNNWTWRLVALVTVIAAPGCGSRQVAEDAGPDAVALDLQADSRRLAVRDNGPPAGPS